MTSWTATSFADRWRHAVAAHGDRTFLVWSGDTPHQVVWTYDEFDRVVDEVAAGLWARGVRRGRSVHVALTSCPTFVAVWLAVTKLGAWLVPSDPQASAPELAGHLGRTRPAVGVCARSRQDVYDTAVAGIDPSVAPAVVVVDEQDVELAELRSKPDGLEFTVAAQDRLAVMFTSGTTSAPKGVVLTQANYAFAGEVMAAACGLDAHDRQLVVLPLFHANAQYYSFASAITVGASVALAGAFSASRFRQQAAELGATHASLFAAPMRMILARDDAGSVDGLGLRHVWFAQNLTLDQYEQFSALVGCRPRQLYGMTETLPAVITQRATATSHDLMGAVTLGCQVKVVDPNSGHEAEPGVVGDLLAGGWPGVTLFEGYLDDPATTEASIVERRPDGFVWFRTGDRAVVESDGQYRFAGRSGDVLKVAGENVSVVEVEAVIAGHPDVFEVAVVGQPDPVRDEVPVAFVVAREGRAVDPDALVAWAAERLSPSKRPRAVHLVDELPRTSVGKIRKFMLRTPSGTEPSSA